MEAFKLSTDAEGGEIDTVNLYMYFTLRFINLTSVDAEFVLEHARRWLDQYVYAFSCRKLLLQTVYSLP